MWSLFRVILVIALCTETGLAIAACTAIPGSDQIWAIPSVHWVFIGELHGSNEAPAAFANLVCDALSKGRQVTVALERPQSEQLALDEVVAGTDLARAQRLLLSLPGWKTGLDGRASRAMLGLLCSLRALKSTYPRLEVFAFDAADANGARERDEAMGNALLKLGRKKPDDLVLVLTGNIHAMRAPLFGYDLAAMFIPANRSLSLEVTDKGGASWSNHDGSCGSFKGGSGDKGSEKPYGIYLDSTLAPFGKVDGVFALGAPLTASPPAAPDSLPLPECRAKFLREQQKVDIH